MPGEKAKTPKKQHQAEFGSPGNYFAEKTIGAVTGGGRSRAAKYAKTLARIEKTYGVPGGVVLAIWGRESGFGSAKIPYDAFEVLGTKAFMSTRKDMFRKEVLAALEIIERGLATRSQMKSSWAGALGQPQFLPSSFLDHAVDFDGDGRRDIWNSAPTPWPRSPTTLSTMAGSGAATGVLRSPCPIAFPARWKVRTRANALRTGQRWGSHASTASRSRPVR